MEKILLKNLVSSVQSDELCEQDVLLDIDNTLTEDDLNDFQIEDYNPTSILDDNYLDANYSDEVTAISIEKLEGLLNGAKENGATHVGIFYHADHFQYEIYGYNYSIGGKQYLEQKAKEEKYQKIKLKEALIERLKAIARDYSIDIEIK